MAFWRRGKLSCEDNLNWWLIYPDFEYKLSFPMLMIFSRITLASATFKINTSWPVSCMKQGMVTTRSTLGIQSQNVKYQLPDFTGSLHCPSLYSHRTSNISFLTLQEVCIVRDLALHYLFVSMLVHCIWGASLIANASRLSVHFGKNMSYVLKHFD